LVGYWPADDIVPNFIPAAGQLDVAIVLRRILWASVDPLLDEYSTGPHRSLPPARAISAPAIWLRAGTERLEDRMHVRSGPGAAAPIQRPAELVPARVLGKRPGRDVVPHLPRDVGPHARPLLGDETSRLPPHDRGALAVEVEEHERSPPRRAHSRKSSNEQ